jgi:hypothetical protein
MIFDNIDEDIDLSKKHLDIILSIIRQGIVNGFARLDVKMNEGVKTQVLCEEFNALASLQSIGCQKEFERMGSKRREDIYFYLFDTNKTKIFFAEAKRLPMPGNTAINSHEYVIGTHSSGSESGGIERYKLLLHGYKHLRNNGMIAYVETQTIKSWFSKINTDLANIYPEDTILVESVDYSREYTSVHKYVKSDDCFTMNHFWIDLTN